MQRVFPLSQLLYFIIWCWYFSPKGLRISITGEGPLRDTVTSLRLGSKGIFHVFTACSRWSVDKRWTLEACTASSTHFSTYQRKRDVWVTSETLKFHATVTSRCRSWLWLITWLRHFLHGCEVYFHDSEDKPFPTSSYCSRFRVKY